MLTTTPDRLSAALADLDPGSRALLDLSLRRGISATEIGELLRKDPADVERGVDEVLELLADALRVEGDDRREQVREGLAELPDAAWQAVPRRPSAPPPPEPAGPPAVPRSEQYLPYYTPKEKRPKAWPIALLLVLLSGLVVGGVLILNGGDGQEGGEQASPGAPADEPGEPDPGPGEPGEPDAGAGEPDDEPDPATGGRTARLKPLHDGPGRGRVTLSPDGARLDIAIRGLPRPNGSYEIWVYDSVVDAQSLGSFSGRSIELDARLPENFADYSFIDVSREPADGNPNHSGASVLRAPVEELLGE